MRFISDDKKLECTAVEFTDNELTQLHPIVRGILATIDDQNQTALGVHEPRDTEIERKLSILRNAAE